MDWPELLDERFGRERALAGSWALHAPDKHDAWQAFVLSPFAPWLKATVRLRGRVEVLEWRCGVAVATLIEHAFTDSDVPNDDVIAALRSAASIGSGDEVRVDFDGRVLRARPRLASGSTTVLAPSVLARDAGAGRARDGALRDLVRALFADDARRDDAEREDLAGLTPELVAEHWPTVEVDHTPALVRVNMRPVSVRRGGPRLLMLARAIFRRYR